MTGEPVPRVEPPLDIPKVVRSLDDLVKLALECEKKPLVDPSAFGDILQKLAVIKQAVDVIHEAYLKTLEKMGISRQDVERFRSDMSHMGEPEKAMFLKLGALRAQCEEARTRIYESLQASRTTLKKLEKDMKKEKEGTQKKGRHKKQKGRSQWMKT
jgi:hypothetical protein